jgi:hypothetical protein
MSAAAAGLAIIAATASAIANGKYFRNDTTRPTPVANCCFGVENLNQITCAFVYRRTLPAIRLSAW